MEDTVDPALPPTTATTATHARITPTPITTPTPAQATTTVAGQADLAPVAAVAATPVVDLVVAADHQEAVAVVINPIFILSNYYILTSLTN